MIYVLWKYARFGNKDLTEIGFTLTNHSLFTTIAVLVGSNSEHFEVIDLEHTLLDIFDCLLFSY